MQKTTLYMKLGKMSDKPIKTNEYPLYPAYKSPLMEFFYQNPDAFIPSLEFRTKTTDFFSKTRDGMDGVMFSKLGLNFEIRKGKFYTSGINILIDRITREVNNIGFETKDLVILAQILQGSLEYYFFASNKEGEELLQNIEQIGLNIIEGKQEMSEDVYKFSKYRDKLVNFFLEEVEEDDGRDEKTIRALSKELQRLITKMNKLDKLTPDECKTLSDVFKEKNNTLKFSSKGISFGVKSGEITKKEAKGLRGIYIKQKTFFTPQLLIAVLDIMFFDKHLYIAYSQLFYDVAIFDKEGLEYLPPNRCYVVLDFSYIIHCAFCTHCLKNIAKDKVIEQFKKSYDDKIDAIKGMFDELCSQVADVCPDDVSIRVEGKVKDKNRFHEVDSKLPNAEVVGFTKHSGEKKNVKFVVKDDLHSRKERLKRRKPF